MESFMGKGATEVDRTTGVKIVKKRKKQKRAKPTAKDIKEQIKEGQANWPKDWTNKKPNEAKNERRNELLVPEYNKNPNEAIQKQGIVRNFVDKAKKVAKDITLKTLANYLH